MEFQHAKNPQDVTAIYATDRLDFLRCQRATHYALLGKNAVATPDNAIMLTVFLKHDQSRSLPELKTQLEKQGYYEAFPPEGVEVVSWNTVMGIGQIVTLRFPASRLIEVNLAFERTAWGSFKTEFYPTYDAKAIALAERDRVLKQRTAQ